MSEELRARSPEEVFDEDIDRNVAPDCVILERRGIFHGPRRPRFSGFLGGMRLARYR